MAVNKSAKCSGIVVYSYFKDREITANKGWKGMESSKLGNEKGVPFFNRRYTTGVPFLSIMAYKRVRGWTNLFPRAFPLKNGWPIF